jgi:hypothetical protein
MIIKRQQKRHRMQVFQIKNSDELSMRHQHESLIVDELCEQAEVFSNTPMERLYHEEFLFALAIFIKLLLPPFYLFIRLQVVDFKNLLSHCHPDIIAPINPDLIYLNTQFSKLIV